MALLHYGEHRGLNADINIINKCSADYKNEELQGRSQLQAEQPGLQPPVGMSSLTRGLGLDTLKTKRGISWKMPSITLPSK